MPLPDVFRVERCDHLGVTRSLLYAQLGAHRWQRPTAVVVTHNGPLSPRQQRLAALLTAASDRSPAALAAWTALEHDGLVGWTRPDTHLLVPRGRRPPDFGTLAVVVHESRRFRSSDVGHSAGLARTSIERSAVDAAVWSRSPRTACGVLAACVQQRLSSAQRLRAQLLAEGRVRHRTLLLAVLTDIDGGAQAVSELDFLAFCRRHALGRPALQQVRRDAAGRRRYLDATLTSRTGVPVHVEIDGALHLTAATYWSDMQRGNDLALVGTHVLSFRARSSTATTRRRYASSVQRSAADLRVVSAPGRQDVLGH